MLVLTRRKETGFDLYLGDRHIAHVTFLEYRHGFVRLGVQAESDVLILREEVERECQGEDNEQPGD